MIDLIHIYRQYETSNPPPPSEVLQTGVLATLGVGRIVLPSAAVIGLSLIVEGIHCY
jgi:hypothetical protein